MLTGVAQASNMIRSSAKLKHKSRSIAKATKKMDVSLSDTSAVQNDVMITRSGRKAGLVNGLSGDSRRGKKEENERTNFPETTSKTHECGMGKTGAKSKDQKKKTLADKHFPYSNKPVIQRRTCNESSTNCNKKDKGTTNRAVSSGNKNNIVRDLKKSPTVLYDWVIKPVPQCHGICVEGQVEGKGDYWHSTTIAEAPEPKLVVTSTGSLYKLNGRMNKLVAYDYGISKDVAKAFTNGFPSTWEDLIKDYYQIMESSITVTQECMSPEKFQALKTKRRLVQDKTILEPVNIHTILTPTGLLKKEMNQSELTTTRSGRVSLPPLAGWAGQYYVKMPGKNSVQVTCATDTAKQALGRETMHALALSKRNQSMLCHNTLSKSLINSSKTASTKPLPSHKKNDYRSGTSNATSSKSKISQRFSKIFSAEKENIFDISFQPEVRLEDCLSPSFTRLKDQSVEDNSILQKQSSKCSDEDESLSNCSDREDKDQHKGQAKYQQTSPQDHPISSKKQKQSQKEKTNKNFSKAGKKKNSSDEFVSESQVERETFSSSTNEHFELLQSSKTMTGQALKNGSSDLTESPLDSKTHNKKSVKKSRKRKIEDKDLTWEGSDSCKKDKKAKSESRSKKQKLGPKDNTDENGWTQSEKERFHKTLKGLSGDEADYWSLVSEQVGTKSEQDCQQFHKEFLEMKTSGMKRPAARKPKKGKKESGREKGGPIRGGKGTLKRKQDIRDFLQEQNEGYEDDLFEGTPFIKLKHNPLMPEANIDFNKEDSEIFGTNHNFFTPVAGKNPFDTPGLKFKTSLPSVRKTPANQAAVVFKATPESVDMRRHDICIKQFMDLKKKAVPSKVQLSHVSSSPEDLETSILPIKSLFPGTPKIFVDDIIEEEQEEEEDAEENGENQFLYYFDDDE